MKQFALGLLASLAALAQQESPQPASGEPVSQIGAESVEKAKRLVVMLNTTLDESDKRVGAGIIFALANERVYIVTADHLVRSNGLKATDLQVEFRWLPGEHFKAELLTDHDNDLDLAVIAVAGLAKTGVAGAHLAWEQIGDPSLLAQGVRGDPVWAIGFPSGTEYEVSAGQLSQVEAVLLKCRVAELDIRGDSGGPIVDRRGLIVGMVRQDQAPNIDTLRIDVILDQLKAWRYHVDLRSPLAPEAFRDTLLRYIEAAPSGFTSVGAAEAIGGWVPSVSLPNAASCQGHGHGRNAVIACAFPSVKSESDALQMLADVVDIVRVALPKWKNGEMGETGWLFFNKQNVSASTVLINLDEALHGTAYDVVLRIHPSSGE